MNFQLPGLTRFQADLDATNESLGLCPRDRIAGEVETTIIVKRACALNMEEIPWHRKKRTHGISGRSCFSVQFRGENDTKV